jgi:probable HAF family extracellular repeat protein
MYSRPLAVIPAICWFAGLASGWATANAQNVLTDLGPGTAYGVNSNGQVVLSNGIWSNGTVTAFSTGFNGLAISSSGQVVGYVSDFQGTNAAFYSDGTVTLIGGVNDDPGVAFASARGINDNGVIVGSGAATGGIFFYAFIYNEGQSTRLSTFPGSSPLYDGTPVSTALGINDAGQVTGQAIKDDGAGVIHEAFIYDSNTATWADLGHGVGNAINASGQVTGQNWTTGYAAVYSGGSESDLGTLPGGTTSTGFAINAMGQIVGSSAVAGSSTTHAFFYNGTMQDMNALVTATDPLQPYVTLTEARGINDSRLIVVNGIDSRTNLQHAYLLRVPPWLGVAPGTLRFASQAIGTVSSTRSVSLTNAGPTPLAIGISIAGNFSETNNCGAALAPSAQCAVMVTFGPTSAGALTGALTVASAGVLIAVIPLLGTAPVQVTISSSAATTTAGVPVKLTWTASPGATCTATGGSSADRWTGVVALSGTKSVTESTAGTYPYGLSCTAGSQSQSTQTSVVVTWPAVSVSLTALPASFTTGQSVTLQWNSINATSCSATGGGAGDTWPGTKAKSGSVTLTEPYAPTTPTLTLTYVLKCTSSASGLAATASAKSIETPAATSGGGGSLDPWAVLFLSGVAALRRFRQSNLRDTFTKSPGGTSI